MCPRPLFPIFFFNDPPPPEISPLSLHDALPIYSPRAVIRRPRAAVASSAAQQNLDYDEAYVRLLLGERAVALQLLGSYLSARPENRAYVAEDRKSTRLNSSHT